MALSTVEQSFRNRFEQQHAQATLAANLENIRGQLALGQGQQQIALRDISQRAQMQERNLAFQQKQHQDQMGLAQISQMLQMMEQQRLAAQGQQQMALQERQIGVQEAQEGRMQRMEPFQQASVMSDIEYKQALSNLNKINTIEALKDMPMKDMQRMYETAKTKGMFELLGATFAFEEAKMEHEQGMMNLDRTAKIRSSAVPYTGAILDAMLQGDFAQATNIYNKFMEFASQFPDDIGLDQIEPPSPATVDQWKVLHGLTYKSAELYQNLELQEAKGDNISTDKLLANATMTAIAAQMAGLDPMEYLTPFQVNMLENRFGDQGASFGNAIRIVTETMPLQEKMALFQDGEQAERIRQNMISNVRTVQEALGSGRSILEASKAVSREPPSQENETGRKVEGYEGTGTHTDPYKVTSQEDLYRLPKGSIFELPDGRKGINTWGI